MGQAAAKQGDRIVANDTHVVLLSNGTPVRLAHAFSGKLDGNLSPDVNIMGRPAATVDSSARNAPAHLPTLPGQNFQKPPGNRGRVVAGSRGVRINGRAAARNGDAAETCNDPVDLPVGRVVASGTVFVG